MIDRIVVVLTGIVSFMIGLLASYFDTGVARAIGIVIVACCLFLFCITLLYGWEKRERK